MKPLSDEQKERFSQAFQYLLVSENLQEFLTLWSEEPEEAMSRVALSKEDINDFRDYLRDIAPPVGEEDVVLPWWP